MHYQKVIEEFVFLKRMQHASNLPSKFALWLPSGFLYNTRKLAWSMQDKLRKSDPLQSCLKLHISQRSPVKSQMEEAFQSI